MGSEAETKSTEPFNAILIEELRRACEDALALRASQRDLPQRVVSVLRRFDAVGLMPVSEEQTDWKLTALVLQTRSPEFWPHLIRAAAPLEQDSALEAVTGLTVTGLTVTAEQRAMPLWNAVLAPMFERYARRQPELNWDPALATRLVDEWRASFTLESFAHRTIAPLHNLRAPEEGTVIDENTVIRAMTDEDRNELWSRFSPVVGGPITLDQLNEWTDVIDVKWAMPRKPPFADEIVVEHVRNVVTAVRLHHMGVTGTTVLWTRLDPDDAPAPGLPPGQTLSTPFGDPTFTRPLRTTLGPDNGQLKELVDRVASARGGTLELALRRFNSAYERLSQEDALIDLWIAFEALALPDGGAELSYRASLRIARLAGSTEDERRSDFDTARTSYNTRSTVVHGRTPSEDLATVVEDTRRLARRALRNWLLDPPPDGIKSIDHAMLT